MASVNCIILLFNGVQITQVNVRKTKETVTDFGENSFTVPPSQISGELVELVSTYKYLEAQTNWQIGFPWMSAEQVKPIQMRQQHYTNVLQICPAEHSVLWLRVETPVSDTHCPKQACSRSEQSTAHDHDSQSKSFELTMCLSLSCTTSLFFLKKTDQVLKDCAHPLQKIFRRRNRSIFCVQQKNRTTRYSKSFVPTSIRLHNKRLSSALLAASQYISANVQPLYYVFQSLLLSKVVSIE